MAIANMPKAAVLAGVSRQLGYDYLKNMSYQKIERKSLF